MGLGLVCCDPCPSYGPLGLDGGTGEVDLLERGAPPEALQERIRAIRTAYDAVLVASSVPDSAILYIAQRVMLSLAARGAQLGGHRGR